MTDESSAAAASKRRNPALRFFAIDDIAECLSTITGSRRRPNCNHPCEKIS